MQKLKRKSALERLSERIITLFDRRASADRIESMKRYYSAVYVGEDYREKAITERAGLLSNCIKVVLAAIVVSILILLAGNFKSSALLDGRLYRPTNADSEEISLVWGTKGSAVNFSGTMDIRVSKKKPSHATIEQSLEYAETQIKKNFPEGNETCGKLDFYSVYPGTDISVVWEPENYNWIYADGSRNARELPEEGEMLTIKVTLSLYDEERSFFITTTLTDRTDSKENYANRLEKLLRKLESESGGEWIELPTEFDGNTLYWEEKDNNGVPVIVLMSAACVVLLVLGEFANRRKKLKMREKQMLNDYPELISKLVLLTQAGMTLRGAVERIANDYRKNGKKHYAYEELCITCREIENGVSEISAFESFGQRCRLLPYLRLASMLEQNLVKGSKSMVPILEQEAANAFADRKEAAKKLGEEAGTKLLLPMAGMLGIVLVLILYPAFTNF